MYHIKIAVLVCTVLQILHYTTSSPQPYFGDYDDDYGQLDSKRNHRRRRPCRKDYQGEERTFLPSWQVQHSTYNYNYNYNCGGNGSPHSSGDNNKPSGHRPGSHQGGLFNNRPTNNKPQQDQVNDVPQHSQSGGNGNRPFANLLQNINNGGGFFGLLDGSLINGFLGNRPIAQVPQEEKPVHEELDDVIQSRLK